MTVQEHISGSTEVAFLAFHFDSIVGPKLIARSLSPYNSPTRLTPPNNLYARGSPARAGGGSSGFAE